MKLNLKKFNQNREKSLKGSKNGDYKLIEHNEGRSNLKEVFSNIQVHLANIVCEHLNVGCELPFWKRVEKRCVDCPMKR